MKLIGSKPRKRSNIYVSTAIRDFVYALREEQERSISQIVEEAVKNEYAEVYAAFLTQKNNQKTNDEE